jgi:hypothetical protein
VRCKEFSYLTYIILQVVCTEGSQATVTKGTEFSENRHRIPCFLKPSSAPIGTELRWMAQESLSRCWSVGAGYFRKGVLWTMGGSSGPRAQHSLRQSISKNMSTVAGGCLSLRNMWNICLFLDTITSSRSVPFLLLGGRWIKLDHQVARSHRSGCCPLPFLPVPCSMTARIWDRVPSQVDKTSKG